MSDQERAKGGDVSVADVLRYLLDKVHPAGRGPYSVPEVAAGSGVSESTLKALRSGRKDNPTLATLHDLAAFFRVPVEVWVSEMGPEWVIARQRLREAAVGANVMKIAMRADGLNADGMDFVAMSIEKARQAQGLGPTQTGLDLNN